MWSKVVQESFLVV